MHEDSFRLDPVRLASGVGQHKGLESGQIQALSELGVGLGNRGHYTLHQRFYGFVTALDQAGEQTLELEVCLFGGVELGPA